MLANIAAHGAQLHWVALKLQYYANIGTILSYRPIFIQYVNIVPIFSQYCLLVGSLPLRRPTLTSPYLRCPSVPPFFTSLCPYLPPTLYLSTLPLSLPPFLPAFLPPSVCPFLPYPPRAFEDATGFAAARRCLRSMLTFSGYIWWHTSWWTIFKAKTCVVNFINRHTLYRSIGLINEIIWGIYYTDSCSAIIIILTNVATAKNCTITRQQRYFKTVRRLNVTVSPFLMTAFSLSGIEPVIFCTLVTYLIKL